MSSRPSHFFCWFIALGLVVGTASGAVNIEQTFEVQPGGKVTVLADRASITVDTHQASTVEVSISGRDWTEDELRRDFDLDLRQNGNEVIVQLKARRKFSTWFSWSNQGLRIDIRIPAVFNVDLETSGGGISVADISGEARARTSGGGIRLGRIDGPVVAKTSGGGIDLTGSSDSATLTTSGGGITIGDISGSAEVSTSGGPIRIREARGPLKASTSGGGIEIEQVFGPVDARTSGGSVRAALVGQPEADCYLGTSGGSVSVKLARELRFDLSAKTSGGRVVTDLPVTVQGSVGKSEINGTLNGGGPRLTLRTSGGSIKIEAL